MDVNVGLNFSGRLCAFAGLILLTPLMLLSCLSSSGYQYYRIKEYETELASGMVAFEMSYAHIRRGEDLGNAVIDSSGSQWEVRLTYWPRCRKPQEVELSVDSVRFITLPGDTPQPLVRFRWKRDQSLHSTEISIGPLSFPKDKYPDIILELVMFVKVRADGTLLERQKYRLRCDHI
jgi:hypothetical protein